MSLRRHARALPVLDLRILDPFAQGMRSTADLGGNGYDRRSPRIMLPLLFQNQPKRSLADFR